jgi:multicomponent Na+:H+ antiporter subunit D
MTLAQHLPALQVVVPLLAAPLTVLLRRRDAAFVVAMAAAGSAFAVALALWQQVAGAGTVSYAIGRWAAPWGIEYRVDGLTTFMLVLVAGIGLAVLPYVRGSIEREVPERQRYLFYTMYLLCLAGLLGIVITGDAFNVFVFLEISSLSTYVLIALGRDRRALLASYQYLVMGTIGATFFVIGIGLLYLMTGTLNIADMAQRIGQVQGSRPVLAALAFLTVGVSLKLALFPLHQWLPGAYAYAPSAVAAFLAGTATKVAVYVLVRFWFGVFGASQVFERLPMQEVMLALALAGMFVASAMAVFQQDLKRVFAYSSVGQIGYIVLGLSFGTATGLTASLVHMLNHGLTKGAIFLLLGVVAAGVGGTSLARVQGLGRTMPWASAALVLGGLSLIGVPGTPGFVTKWYLVLAAIEQQRWWLVALIVASSLLTMVYVWRFVEAAYFNDPRKDLEPVVAPTPGMRLACVVLVAAMVWCGLDTRYTVVPAAGAAAALTQGAR